MLYIICFFVLEMLEVNRNTNLKTRSIKYLRLMAVSACICALFSAPGRAGEKKISIAVLDLEVREGVSKQIMGPVTDRLREELFNLGKYRILDRKNMEKILQQQGINLSDCTSSECAVNVGQMLSVDKIVTGSVNKIGEVYFINASMINVGTGEIEGIGNVKCSCEGAALPDSMVEVARKITGVKEAPVVEEKPKQAPEESEEKTYEEARPVMKKAAEPKRVEKPAVVVKPRRTEPVKPVYIAPPPEPGTSPLRIGAYTCLGLGVFFTAASGFSYVMGESAYEKYKNAKDKKSMDKAKNDTKNWEIITAANGGGAVLFLGISGILLVTDLTTNYAMELPGNDKFALRPSLIEGGAMITGRFGF